jgi:hypothetical protein
MKKNYYTKETSGEYMGIEYKRKRICDVMVLEDRSFAFFLFVKDKPSGDFFMTKREFEKFVDRNLQTLLSEEFQDLISEEPDSRSDIPCWDCD